MAHKSSSSNDKAQPSGPPEERYLDLWEENIRLLANSSIDQKRQNGNG